MQSIRLGFAFVWLVVSALAAAQRAGQGGADAPSGATPLSGVTAKSFTSTVDLVTLNVTITDGRNRQVSGLGRGDFQVLEEGAPQPLSFFAATEVPLDVTLLVDTSSSMADKRLLVQKAAQGFIKSLRPADRASVVGFATRVVVLQPFTSDHAALMAAVTRTTANGDTALYSAIYVALDQLVKARQHSGEVRRPAIIVLTDGEDTASSIAFEDLLDRARRAGVAIYPISIVDEFEAKRLTDGGERRFIFGAQQGLTVLARETGARAYFPSRLTELDGVYRSVAEELSLQYALGYVSTSGRVDGAYRRLVVRVLSHPELKSRTRAGYYAAGPLQAANGR